MYINKNYSKKIFKNSYTLSERKFIVTVEGFQPLGGGDKTGL